MLKLGSEIALGCDMINATNRSSNNGFGRANPCIRFEGKMPLGTFSCVAEAHNLRQMGSTCVSSLVSLALHNLKILCLNLQLALHTIRSYASLNPIPMLFLSVSLSRHHTNINLMDSESTVDNAVTLA